MDLIDRVVDTLDRDMPRAEMVWAFGVSAPTVGLLEAAPEACSMVIYNQEGRSFEASLQERVSCTRREPPQRKPYKKKYGRIEPELLDVVILMTQLTLPDDQELVSHTDAVFDGVYPYPSREVL